MPRVWPADGDFRICRIGFQELVVIQAEAEERGWSTRWTSEQALRGQVKEEPVLLHPLIREERAGAVHSYRCLVLFSTVDRGGAGGVVTVDVEPARFSSFERIDQDPTVRQALVRIFSLASAGISMVPKD